MRPTQDDWNRYYDPVTGSHLQPEPMLAEPGVVAATAKLGVARAHGIDGRSLNAWRVNLEW